MCYIEELKLKVKKLEARIKELESSGQQATPDVAGLVEALEEISDPIRFMKERLEEGERLNGMAAVQLAEDASYLRGIARTALAAHHKQGACLEVNLNFPKGDLVRVHVDGKVSYRPLAGVTTLEIPELGERIIRMDPLLYEGEEAIHSLDGRITIVRTKA